MGPYTLSFETGVKTWTLEAVARYVFLPEKPINPYFIGGLGVGQVMAHLKTKFDGPGISWADTNFDGTARGTVFSLGAGLDGDTDIESLIASLDFRWRYISAKKDFTDRLIPGATHSITSWSALTLSVKFGYKFGR